VKTREEARAYGKEWRARPEVLIRERARCENFRRDHLEEAAANQKRWRQADPKRYMLYRAKCRAKEKKLEFDITKDDIDLPEICPVLGIQIIYGLSKQCRNSPTIDRMDCSKGYVKGNVRVISWRANDLKRDASIGELEAIIRYMKDG
jgi:hypothetical protein